MGYGCEVAFTAISVAGLVGLAAAVVPVEGSRRLGAYGRGVAVRLVEYGVKSLTCEALKYGEEFVAAINLTSAITPALCIVATLYLAVGTSGTYLFARSVLTSRGCLAHHLGASVTIEIIDHKLGVVCSSTDVHA